ncbi:olfactory receptor 5AR1-like [Ambystoma mexicanum]|uniref:olfactory receptor 5AR1-like n=1 Tax=Ambystoma mexicanum TaxID=8296 RepID=UPI0037E7BFF1
MTHSLEEEEEPGDTAHRLEDPVERGQMTHSLEEEEEPVDTAHRLEDPVERGQMTHSLEEEEEPGDTAHRLEDPVERGQMTHSLEEEEEPGDTAHRLEDPVERGQMTHSLEEEEEPGDTAHYAHGQCIGNVWSSPVTSSESEYNGYHELIFILILSHHPRSVENMDKSNQTFLAEFLILGLSQNPQLQLPIFIVFLLMYSITLIGNLVIITIIFVDANLHNPMYFFLLNLSFLDVGFTSVTIPKMLAISSTGDGSMNFSLCILQFYLCFSFLSTEFFLLSAMAYDRYIAICQPLRYTLIMNERAVIMLATTSWTLGFLDTIPHAVLISKLSFCASREINHFFCDLNALLKLSCTDTYFINVATFGDGVVIGLGPFTLTLISYVFIISNILKIPSATGRHKSFSTCSSHLTAVVLFYGSELGVYMRPTSAYSLEKDKLFAILYTIIIPMLNPIVYSLRNSDVKRAMKKTIKKLCRCRTMLHEV